MKKILVPNGNYTDIRLIKAFKKLGYYVITSGNAPELEGHKYADEYVAHDYSDYKGMLEIAQKLQIDNISACSNDFGVTTAAYIAEKMGLPGHDTFEVAKIIAEKDLFKKFAQENGLQVIPSNEFYDKEEAMKHTQNCEYPIIVKPTDLGGGKGVTRVDSVAKAEEAIDLAFAKSKAKHIVIEPFVEGDQGSFCSFIVDGKVKTYTTFNEFDGQNSPFLVGYTSSPAFHTDIVVKTMIEQTEKMAELLKLADGIFHIQYRFYNGKPYIMECMRRCLGNYALKSASYMNNIEWEEWIAKAYIGEDCSKIPQNSDEGKFFGHYYIQAPRNGYVKDVIVSDEVKKYAIDEIMQWSESKEITNYIAEMLGFVFCVFPTVEERDDVSSRIYDLITVEMK